MIFCSRSNTKHDNLGIFSRGRTKKTSWRFLITKKDRTTGLEENKRKDLFTSNQFYDASQIENESILYKFKNKRKKNSFISSLPQLDFDASSKNTTMAQKWQRDSSNRKKNQEEYMYV